MTAKELLKKFKALFEAPIDVAPADTTTSTIFSYPVDGGGPVYVDCSDDGLADIDANDKVYTDAAMTAPYPDGTYNVTGTTFGFTVAGGIVIAVNDTAGTGPGVSLEEAMAKQAPPTPPAPPAPAPPPPPVTKPAGMAAEAKTPEEITALYESFANGIVDPANIAIVLKALMENCFGWQIQEQQRKATADQAINIYKQDLTAAQAAVATASAAMAKQEKSIAKHEETIKGMFELIEKMVEAPTANPKTLTGNKKEKFDRAAQKEEKFQAILEAVKKAAKDKKY